MWIFVFSNPMYKRQKRLFWNEVESIQAKHSLFFPKGQKKSISIQLVNSQPKLVLSKNYNLPKVITMEIEFAFKLCFQ